MRYNLKNIDRLEWFDADDIKQLEKWGIPVVQVNYTSQKYMEDFSELITKHIVDCEKLFPNWVNFEYIKSLFVLPKKKNKNVYQSEFAKFMQYNDLYPFQKYIYWEPYECGSILLNDEKFVEVLYKIHNEDFDDKT